MLYVCKNCGTILDEDDFVVKNFATGGEYPYVWEEKEYFCPHCSSDEYDKYFGPLKRDDNLQEHINDLITKNGGGFVYNERFGTYSKCDEEGNELCCIESDGTITIYGDFLTKNAYSAQTNNEPKNYYIDDKPVPKEAFFAYARTHTQKTGVDA